MTTINTINDLMRLLDESPEWLEAVRSRILTRELLELPHQFAQFVATTNERFDRIEGQIDRIEGRMDQFDGRMDQLDGRMDRIEGRMDQFDGRMDQFDGRMDRFERSLNRLINDFGEFRGKAASDATLKNAAAIAAAIGLIRIRNISQDELVRLAREQDTADIPRSDLDSFYVADLIMEAADDDGQLYYVAVEASFTADERDTRRAIRNAGYMTRFTGQPSRTVIVALRTDNRVSEQIASGAVHWYKMPELNMGRD